MSLAQCSKDELQISLILKTRITQFGAHLCTNPLWKQLQEKDENRNIFMFSNPTNWSLLGKQVHFYYYYFYYYYYYLFHRCYYFHCYYYHNYYHYHYISQQEPVVKTSKCTPATPTSPTGTTVSLLKSFSHSYLPGGIFNFFHKDFTVQIIIIHSYKTPGYFPAPNDNKSDKINMFELLPTLKKVNVFILASSVPPPDLLFWGSQWITSWVLTEKITRCSRKSLKTCLAGRFSKYL